MSFPVLIQLGPLTIHPHWVFETLAYAIAFAVYRRQRGRFGDVVDSRARWYVIAAAAVGGYAGSRLLHLIESPVQLVRHGGSPLFLLGGKTIVGGLIGGLAAVEWTKQRLGVRIATGDLFAIPLAIGIAIGRIGCFLSGLEDGTYGVATRLPWGVDFGDRIARHPTQVYEIVFLAALVWLIIALRRRLADAGDTFKLFMIGYMAFRLGVDFIKPGARIGGLSVIQWACLATLAYYVPNVPRLICEVTGD